MKHLLKQSMLIATTAALLMSSVIGCKPDDSKKPDNSTATSGSTSVNSSTASGPVSVKDYPRKDPVIIDLKGEKVKIGSWWTEEPTPDDSDAKKYFWKRVEEAEKKFNCDIEFVSTNINNYYTNIEASIVAEKPWADFCYYKMAQSFPLVYKGYVMPVSDYDVIDLKDPIWDKLTLDNMTVNNKCYGLMGAKKRQTYMLTNDRLIQETGLEHPSKLFARGEWTWDKFRDIAVKATKTIGDKQQYGYVGGGPDFDVMYWAHSNDGFVYDSKFNCGLKEANATEAINFLNKLATVDKVVYPTNKHDPNVAVNAFNNGEVAIFNQIWLNDRVKDMADDYTMIPFPKGPKAKEHHTFVSDIDMYCMMKGVSNPKGKLAVYNYVYGYPNPNQDEDSWLEGIEKLSRNEESIENVKRIEAFNQRFDYTFVVNLNWASRQDYFDKIIYVSPAVAFETYQAEFDARVAENKEKYGIK